MKLDDRQYIDIYQTTGETVTIYNQVFTCKVKNPQLNNKEIARECFVGRGVVDSCLRFFKRLSGVNQ